MTGYSKRDHFDCLDCGALEGEPHTWTCGRLRAITFISFLVFLVLLWAGLIAAAWWLW